MMDETLRNLIRVAADRAEEIGKGTLACLLRATAEERIANFAEVVKNSSGQLKIIYRPVDPYRYQK